MYFEIYKDRANRWRWRLRARNKNILADSGQSYSGGRSVIVKKITKMVEGLRGLYIEVIDLTDGDKKLRF